jgi:hypothetical protein
MTALQYAILHHEGIAEPHFDLLFETLPGSELAAWRSPAWPIEAAVSITRLSEHRRIYLDYEGDLSRGRGRVSRVARGTCRVEIGEGGVWTVTILTGGSPLPLRLQHIEGERWEASTGGTPRG